MKITAIICAAGKGERAGFGKNKLLAPLYGAPALWWTLRAFASEKIQKYRNAAFPSLYKDGFNEVIVVCSEQDMEEIAVLCKPFGFKTVTGGATRTKSVYNALCAAEGDIVIIHDGARPFVTEADLTNCINGVKEYKSAVCATPSTDTVAIAENGAIEGVPDRTTVYALQTPQGFLKSELLPAYKKAIESGETFTDDSSVYLKYVAKPHIFIGESENRKLTYAKDFEFVKLPPMLVLGIKTGFGVDVHAFGKEQDYITLCGVKIPCDNGLIAHSDGDVAVHAVMDSALSAAGLKDIGYYFPDTDPKYKGADSLQLLRNVVCLIGERGFKLCALSVAIQAEKPKLAPYIEEMKKNLAEAVGISEYDVGISAGTCEGLGFVGERRGICVYAQCSVKEITLPSC